MFSCEERGLEVEGVVQTRERRGDWGLVRGACLLARGAKVQNTNHWLEVGAASAASSNQPSLGAGSSENSIYCFSNDVFQKGLI